MFILGLSIQNYVYLSLMLMLAGALFEPCLHLSVDLSGIRCIYVEVGPENLTKSFMPFFSLSQKLSRCGELFCVLALFDSCLLTY